MPDMMPDPLDDQRIDVNWPLAKERIWVLPKYATKPQLDVGFGPMFGELVIVQQLRAKGWEAVWNDLEYGDACWNGMPGPTEPVMLPFAQQMLLAKIAKLKGSRGGAFDVIAWKEGERTRFYEFKGPGDRPNKNEAAWIDAALEAGVSLFDLWRVVAKERL
jgi:hypothetical protein